MREHINANTIAIVGSAGNYPYGTIDPIEELSRPRGRSTTSACTSTAASAASSCRGARSSATTSRVFDFRLPGVTTISRRHAQVRLRPQGHVGARRTATTTCAPTSTSRRTDWQGGKYLSPGLAGSRSGGLIAATWASMVSLGREGYLGYAKQIFETSYAMQDAVTSHAELRLMGTPTWCFSFTSDVFDIYHVNDFMKQRGWRFNGQQYPNAMHMCVTRPQTQPGVVESLRHRPRRGRGVRPRPAAARNRSRVRSTAACPAARPRKPGPSSAR